MILILRIAVGIPKLASSRGIRICRNHLQQHEQVHGLLTTRRLPRSRAICWPVNDASRLAGSLCVIVEIIGDAEVVEWYLGG
jgi:hypothetical protein